MKRLLSTKEVSAFLGVNEKMVYTLIAEKGLPATRITGKWLFPSHLVEQWVESMTINYPGIPNQSATHPDLLVVAGSNDILLDRALSLFMRIHPQKVAVFGNLGSLGGLRALRQGLCHMATSHLMQDDEMEFNFSFAAGELPSMPAVVNFCRREQGLLLAPGNPKNIRGVADLGREGMRMVNRPLSTGTRLLLDRELAKAGVDVSRVQGYEREVGRHLEVGMEILSGRADVGPAVHAAAGLLGLDFLPLHWERFDLLVPKERFFDQPVQQFLSILHDPEFRSVAKGLEGYDLSQSGKMIFPEGAALPEKGDAQVAASKNHLPL
jgi:putative molybdopterin biosynthesis protein